MDDAQQAELIRFTAMADDELFEALGGSLAGGHAATPDPGANAESGRRLFASLRTKICDAVCSNASVKGLRGAKSSVPELAAVIFDLLLHSLGLPPPFAIAVLTARSISEMCDGHGT